MSFRQLVFYPLFTYVLHYETNAYKYLARKMNYFGTILKHFLKFD